MPSTTAKPPSITVLKVRPPQRRGHLGWVAHVVGAAAATILIAVGMLPAYLYPRPAALPGAPAAVVARAAPVMPEGPIALAGPGDVSLMDVEMTVPGYNLVVAAGDDDDVVAVLVVPSKGNG